MLPFDIFLLSVCHHVGYRLLYPIPSAIRSRVFGSGRSLLKTLPGIEGWEEGRDVDDSP